MTMTMKGLMKGFRYLTSMFDQEREPEMQIGGPTDVKHVAHIGWDGPTANAPSWMDKFKGEGGDPTASSQHGSRGLLEITESPTKPRMKGARRGGAGSGSTDSPKCSVGGSDSQPQAAKPSRKKKSKASSSGGGSSNKTGKAKGRVAQTDLGGSC